MVRGEWVSCYNSGRIGKKKVYVCMYVCIARGGKLAGMGD